MITGISHLTFIVRDVDKSAALFQAIFDAHEFYNSGDKSFSISREKYLAIGDLWICIMEGESLPEKTYNHVAFQIADSDFSMYEERIRLLGLDIHPSRPRVPEEGRSLYFYDYDNHLFELHAGTLENRMNRYMLPD